MLTKLIAASAALTITSTLTLTPTVSADSRTVYTLQPLNFNLEDSLTPALQGTMCLSPNTCVQVKHPAALGSWSITAGADNLNTALNTDGLTDVTVFALSQGAQSVTEWGDKYAAALPSPERVTFVLIGNPERSGGFRDQNGFTSPTTHNPDPDRFTYIDIARQYDGWADWPDRFEVLAVINATMGMFTVHNDYVSISAPTSVEEIHQTVEDDPDADKNLVWKKNDTYYVLNKTDILPIARPLTWVGLNDTAKKISDDLRPRIEAAYDRPDQGSGLETAPTQERKVSTDTVSDEKGSVQEDKPSRSSRSRDRMFERPQPKSLREDSDETRPRSRKDRSADKEATERPDRSEKKPSPRLKQRSERSEDRNESRSERDSSGSDE